MNKLISSPFPGMDPYLEGAIWLDFCQRLATEISDLLTPHLRPRYVARLAVATIYDQSPEHEIGILYPDVEIIRRRKVKPVTSASTLVKEVVRPISKALTVPILDFSVRVANVEIYDRQLNQLITSIEILSPVNKREPGLGKYRQKQRQLQEAGVHLLEIDLLRRGQRPTFLPGVPDSPYIITLTRAGAAAMDVWPVRLQDELPVVAVPLRAPDDDLPLDLGLALSRIYDKAAYDLSLDYTQPPPPPALSTEDQTWLQQQVSDQ